MQRNYHFIVNKLSSRSQQCLSDLSLLAPEYTQNYHIHLTQNLDQLDLLLKELKPTLTESDVFVSVGGDGSLNQLINHLKKHELPQAVAILPGGTGNDFARANNLSLDFKEAVDHLFTRYRAVSRDIIRATHGKEVIYAVNSIGFGLDGLIISLLDEARKGRQLQSNAYARSILKAFLKLKKFPATLTINGQKIVVPNTQLMLVGNNRFIGGNIDALPKARNTDGKLDVLVASDVGLMDLFNILARLFTNGSHLKNRHIQSFVTDRLQVQIDSSQHGQADGEWLWDWQEMIDFQIVPQNFWM